MSFDTIQNDFGLSQEDMNTAKKLVEAGDCNALFVFAYQLGKVQASQEFINQMEITTSAHNTATTEITIE